jgi:hypothetical protein
MSIMMSASETIASDTARRHEAHEIEPSVRSLLDHIAVELAEEYVRLMEAAAASENSAHQKEDYGQ